jgi:hypothetical protein
LKVVRIYRCHPVYLPTVLFDFSTLFFSFSP